VKTRLLLTRLKLEQKEKQKELEMVQREIEKENVAKKVIQALIDIQDDNGISPCMKVKKKKLGNIQTYLEKHAKLPLGDYVDDWEHTPIHLICSIRSKECLPILKLLVEKFDLNVHARDSRGQTAVHTCVSSANIPCLKYLVKSCAADPCAESKSEHNKTPIVQAISSYIWSMNANRPSIHLNTKVLKFLVYHCVFQGQDFETAKGSSRGKSLVYTIKKNSAVHKIFTQVYKITLDHYKNLLQILNKEFRSNDISRLIFFFANRSAPHDVFVPPLIELSETRTFLPRSQTFSTMSTARQLQASSSFAETSTRRRLDITKTYE